MEEEKLDKIMKEDFKGSEQEKAVIKDAIATLEEDFGELEVMEPKPILECMNCIVDKAVVNDRPGRYVFNEAVYSACEDDIRRIANVLDITPRQAVLLSLIVENCSDGSISRSRLAGQIGLSYIKTLSFNDDFKVLKEKKLMHIDSRGDFRIPKRALTALSENRPVQKQEVTGLNTDGLLAAMHKLLKLRSDDELAESDMMSEIDYLVEQNPDAGFVRGCHNLKILDENQGMPYWDRLVFLIMVDKYVYDDDDNICWCDLEDFFEDEDDRNFLRNRYNSGRMIIQQNGPVEPVNENGFANNLAYHIKDEIKDTILAEVGGSMKSKGMAVPIKVKKCIEIGKKDMFYNKEEQSQICRLSSLLDEHGYKSACTRLKDKGLRTGFSCLFYGGPGTGKTETVYQIARETGRDLIPVNVQDIKSCWVGESEKQIKGIFDNYRRLVEQSETAPILLFNEADAIFGIRNEGATHAVDKMENSIQNIILQEMEKLDGILIATTNLTENLDPAFERRFLYKIHFNSPENQVRAKIWHSMIPALTEEQALELATDYTFSGGQIENITRKREIKFILDGVEPDFEEIRSYCIEERINDKRTAGRRIGFKPTC